MEKNPCIIIVQRRTKNVGIRGGRGKREKEREGRREEGGRKEEDRRDGEAWVRKKIGEAGEGG